MLNKLLMTGAAVVLCTQGVQASHDSEYKDWSDYKSDYRSDCRSECPSHEEKHEKPRHCEEKPRHCERKKCEKKVKELEGIIECAKEQIGCIDVGHCEGRDELNAMLEIARKKLFKNEKAFVKDLKREHVLKRLDDLRSDSTAFGTTNFNVVLTGLAPTLTTTAGQIYTVLNTATNVLVGPILTAAGSFGLGMSPQNIILFTDIITDLSALTNTSTELGRAFADMIKDQKKFVKHFQHSDLKKTSKLIKLINALKPLK